MPRHKCLAALQQQYYHLCSLDHQMMMKCDRREGFGYDNVNLKSTIPLTPNIYFRETEEKHGHRGFSSQLLKSARRSAVRFFHLLNTKTSRVLHFISRRRRQPPSKAPSNMTPQRFAPPGDSHLSEAIEDCIKFLNSSSRRSC